MNASGTRSGLSDSPSSPPVIRPGSRTTRIDPACANAKVTMARAMPETRSEIAPNTKASRVPEATAISADHSSGSSRIPMSSTAR